MYPFQGTAQLKRTSVSQASRIRGTPGLSYDRPLGATNDVAAELRTVI